MTDEQLLELIETHAPEELTLAEIEQLRGRLATSSVLRAALSTRLEMEQYLASALGRINVSVDDIISRAGNASALRSNPVLPLLGWVLCVVLVGFVGLALILTITVPPANDKKLTVADAREGADANAGQAEAEPEQQPGPAATNNETKPSEEPAVSAAAETVAAVPAPVAEAKPAAPKNPWDELAAAEDRPRPSAAALFDDVDPTVPTPREEDLKQWFSEAHGQPHGISRKDFFGNPCGVLDGVWQLRAPLKPKTALRLTLAEFHNLKLHFWHGQQGVTLQYLENANQLWLAYGTTRKAAEARPEKLVLIGSDEDRFWRTNPAQPATFELRLEAGVLTLVRGDVRVLSVPFAGTPSEVYFDGHAVFRQIAMVGAADLPAERPPHPVLVDITRPAQLKWSGELNEGTDFQKLPDGAVELSGEKNAHWSWASVPLPHRESLCEIVFRVEDPQPGTGVFLGDDQGPRYQLGFFREAHAGQTSFGPAGVGDARVDSNHDIQNAPAPLAGGQPWFRLLFGCGTLKCWTSADGIHWGRAFDPWTNQQASFSHLGIYCVPGQPRKAIRLRQVQLRELAALDSLAPAEMRRKAPALPQAPDTSEWLEGVLQQQPAGADSAQWRRACALRTLAAGAPAALATPLLDSLIEELLSDHKPAAVQMQLLDEAALLHHGWDDPNAALRFAQYYERVGNQAYRAGQARPYLLVAHAQRTAPIWSRHVYNFLPESLVRTELLELVQAGQWGELHEFCRQQQFWRHLPPGQPQTPGLLEWADGLALQQLPKRARRGGPVMPADWRHPLLVELSKEGYNVLAEFRAALDGRSYRDACQIISTSAENGLLGLLPDSRDAELLVSLPGAVSLAMREHPDLRSTMSQQFGPLGRLRIRQAISENEVTAVEASTIQFFGTPAAAEAHLWLGDRALAGGAFAHALGQYREAEHAAPPELRGRIAASEQLAAALMGQTAGEPVNRSVTFGDTELSAGDLQALVADLKQHRLADNLTSRQVVSIPPMQPAMAASGFEAVARFRLEGDAGDAPQNVSGELQPLNVDWVARQLSVTVDGDRLLLSNRFQLSAYDLKQNKLEWRSELGGEHASAHEWPLMPMRPAVTNSRIFARRLQRAGPVLSCFEGPTGKVLWTSKIEPEKWVVSDPVLIQDELFALAMTRLEQEFTLSLCTYDPQSGAVLSTRALLHYREPWWHSRTCQVAPQGDTLIVTCGGTVLCCDLLGQVRWVRRQTWLPPNLDRFWLAQSQDPPLVADGRLFIVQPGVRSLAALEPDSGRLLWRRALPGVRRIVGQAGGRLLVELTEGFVAVEAESGKTLWTHEADKRLDAVLCGEPGGLVYTTLEAVKGENNWRPHLVWVDLADGTTKAQTTLESLKHDRPKFGPLLRHGDRVLAFFGRGDQDATRDVVELTPKGPALAAPELASGLDRWNRATDPALKAAAAEVLPKWTLLGGRVDGATGVQPEWQQEKGVLNTLAVVGRPLKLVQRIAVPAGGNPRLQLRVANDPQGKWKLEVQTGSRTLLTQVVDQAFTGGAWKDLEVDLKPFSGQHIWLVVRQSEEGGPQPYAKWKRLQLVP